MEDSNCISSVPLSTLAYSGRVQVLAKIRLLPTSAMKRIFCLQFFSIALAHFTKQKLHSQNNTCKPPNHCALVHNRFEFLIPLIKLQLYWHILVNDKYNCLQFAQISNDLAHLWKWLGSI